MKTKEHPLYSTWLSMRQRCNTKTTWSYPYYGGRGITVCPEWDNFWQFVADMGKRPEGHTLDRIDNDKGYSADNCRWATKKEQVDNRRPPKRREGAKGYHQYKGKYFAQARLNGTTHYLGLHDCPLMAHLAYKDFINEHSN